MNEQTRLPNTEEDGSTITLLTSSGVEPRTYHALVWLCVPTPDQPYSRERQENEIGSKVQAAQEAALVETAELSVRGDPLYPSVVCELTEPDAIALAQALAPKIGNVTVLQRVVIGHGHGAVSLDPVVLYE